MMYSKVEERQNDLRNTTVLEVILAVIIILLCVVYIKDTEIKDMEKNYIQKIEKLQEQNKMLLEERRELRKDNRKLRSEIERLERKIKRLTAKKPGATRYDAYEDEITELEAEIKRLKAENEILRATKKSVVKPGGRGGKDKPSCLKDSGKIAYFASIKRRGKMYEFLPTGNAINQSKALSIPGAAALLTQGPLNITTYKKLAGRIFEYGQNSNPSCVYYVKLDPNDWTGGEIKTVERYFYKSYGND